MTDPARHLLTIFSSALERKTPEERVAYLDEACAGSAEVRARVEALLRAHEQSGGGFLESPTSPHVSPGSPAVAPSEKAGSVIGPYKLLQEIGEGGMGTVFMAEQTEPIRRRVALKVVKAGMDSKAVLARFEAERQALALMDHPNIARALDAGATPSGRPYFVMELVKGTPITRYCDEHRLGLRERLALFISVCQAVQHAHQKGVIHRDIKPSNVLVAPYDGRPVAKVIDFGIAKATGQPLTEKTLFTGFGAVVGTPEYMSPEQAELNNQDIDTRSDVYSLGAMLYELLTGTTPLTAARARKAALLEVLRLVREEEPPRPSTRLSSTEELPRIATDRGTDPKRLSRLVRGELDWIVMKALDKDRSRRYETAYGLAADLGRYLDGEPVAACPPSAAYRLRKFASRYRAALAVATVFALTLVAGAGVSVWQAVRATDAETEANGRAEAEKAERLRAVTAEVLANSRAEELRRQRRQAQLDLSTHLLDRGLRLCGEDRVDEGLLWIARGLSRAPEDADDLRRVIRTNLSGWTERSARRKFALKHRGAVRRVAFRPDGKTVVTASETRERRQGPHLTEAMLRTMPLTVAAQMRARLRQDAGEPWEGEVRCWDVATGQPVGRTVRHRGFPVALIGISPDARTAVVGSDFRTAQLIDLEAGSARGRSLVHQGPGVLGVQFSEDGQTLLTWTSTTVHLWDAQTGQRVGRPLSPANGVAAAALSPDGRTLLTAAEPPPPTSDRTPAEGSFMQFWDARTGIALGTPIRVAGGCTRIAFSPDRRHVLAAGYLTPSSGAGWPGRPWGGVWNAETLAAVGKPWPPASFVEAVVFSPDGRLALLCNKAAQIWVARRDPDRDWFSGGSPLGLEVLAGAFSPDGRWLLSCSAGPGGPAQGQLTSVNGRRHVVKVETPGVALACAFSPDGRNVVLGCNDGLAWACEVPVDREVPSRSLSRPESFALAATPDGRLLLTEQGDGNSPRLFSISQNRNSTTGVNVNLNNGKGAHPSRNGGTNITLTEKDGRPRGGKAKALRHQGVTTAAAVSPDGKRAVVAAVPWVPGQANGPYTTGGRTTLWWWDGRSWASVGPGKGPEGYVVAMAFSADNRTLLVGMQDGTARCWDTATWRPSGSPLRANSSSPAVALAVSRDGRTALVGGGREATLVSLATGKPVSQPIAHQGDVLVAAFSEDGRRVVTGGADRTARVWDAASGKPVGLVLTHRGEVTGACFSPNGQVLMTSGGNDGARFWDLNTGKPLGPSPLKGHAVGFRPNGQAVALSDERIRHLALPAAAPVSDQQWALFVRLSSGRELDPANVVGWMTLPTFDQARARLATLGGPPPPAVAHLDWHRREAADSLRQRDWHAALWHLDRLIAAEPNNWRHHLDRAGALAGTSPFAAGLGRAEEAVKSLDRAAALGADGEELWERRAVAHESLKLWLKVAEARRRLAELRGGLGDRVAEAEALLRGGDDTGYRRACAGLLATANRDPGSVSQVLLLCLQAKSPPVPAERLIPLAQSALADANAALGKETGALSRGLAQLVVDDLEMALALALYRAGRFDAAFLRAAWAENKSGGSYWALVTALAQHRRGQAAEAIAALERVSKTEPRGLKEGRYAILLREAEEAIGRRYLLSQAQPILHAAFLPGGRQGLCATEAGEVRILDLITGVVAKSFQVGRAHSVAVSPDGRNLLVCRTDATVLFDLTTGRRRPPILRKSNFHRAAITPDGKQAVLVAYKGDAALIELETFKVVRRHKFSEGLWSVDVSPRGGFALVAGGTPFPNNRAALHLWDLKTGEVSSPFEQLKGGLWQGVLSPDGTQALSAGLDGHVRLWDVKSGKVTRSMAGHTGEVSQVAFAPDGRRALSGGSDGTVRLWDLATGKELAAIKMPGRQALSFSADGKQALVGGGTGQVVLWRLPTQSANGR